MDRLAPLIDFVTASPGIAPTVITKLEPILISRTPSSGSGHLAFPHQGTRTRNGQPNSDTLQQPAEAECDARISCAAGLMASSLAKPVQGR